MTDVGTDRLRLQVLHAVVHAKEPPATRAGLLRPLPRPIRPRTEQHGGASADATISLVGGVDAKKQDLEEVSGSLLDSLQTLLAIPFDTALMVYQEYSQKYSPPSPLQIAKSVG